MFARIKQSKAVLIQQFSVQFDTYQGHLVYRAQQKGPPIKVTEDEVEDWVAGFERQLLRFFWAAMIWFLGTTFGLIIFDESAILPIPDWLPLVVACLILPAGFFYIRHLNRGPSRSLAGGGRPAMGGERSKDEMKIIAIRQMPWNAVIVPIILGFGGLVLIPLLDRAILRQHPFLFGLFALFVLYLFVAGLVLAKRKYDYANSAPD